MYSNPDFFAVFISLLKEYIKITQPDVLDRLNENQIQLLVFPFNEVFTLFMNGIKPNVINVINTIQVIIIITLDFLDDSPAYFNLRTARAHSKHARSHCNLQERYS